MPFNGYLLKINGVIFPNKFILMETLITTPNQIQEDDPYRDSNGKLHHSELPHTVTKIEFNTPTLKQADNEELQTFFASTRNISVEYWNPKIGTYQTGIFYAPDLDFTIKYIIAGEIYYNPIRIALIED